MKVWSQHIKNNFLDDAFGHRGIDFIKTKPCRSFHIGWEGAPENTQSLALIFLDYEAIPVCGFPWIHWTVANIAPGQNGSGELRENLSVEGKLLEGVTSWNSGLLSPEWYLEKEDATGYGGCAPPDKAHLYTVDVYALDTTLQLERGFFMNELINGMKGHVLAQAKIDFWYKAKEQ
jgi:Raf kinase inhibitor-like YbhB/YbcL family protein